MKFNLEEKRILKAALLCWGQLREAYEAQAVDPAMLAESRKQSTLGKQLSIRFAQSLKEELIKNAANKISDTVYYGTEGKEEKDNG